MPEKTMDAHSDWAMIIDNLHESVITSDAEGYVVNWSKGAERLFGYTAEQAIGLHADICLESSPETVMREVTEPLLRDGHVEFFGKMVRKSGETFDGHMLASLITGPDGAINGMVGYTLDITEKRRAEAELAVQTNLLQRAEKIADIGHFHRYFDGGKMYWSDGMFQVFGVDKQTFILTRETAYASLHPDDVEDYMEQVEAAIARGGSFRSEVRALRPDGEIRYLQAEGETEVSDNGEPIAVFGVVKDVTEAREAEAEIRKREAELSTITRLSPIGIFRTDQKGMPTFVNDRWYEIIGFPSGQDPAFGWHKSLHPDDCDAAIKNWEDCVAQGIPYVTEFRVVRPDGSIGWTYAEATPERGSNGEVIGYVGFTLDITERKASADALEEERQRSEEARLLLEDAVESFTEGFALYDADDRLILCNDAYMDEYREVEEYLQPGVPFETFIRAIYGTKELISSRFNEETIIQKRLAVHRNPETGPWQVEMTGGRWLSAQEYRTRQGGTALIRSDVTARTDAEKKLRDSEDRFRDFASATSDWFWEIGADGLVKFISSGFKQFSGHDPEEFVGKPFIEGARFFQVEAEPSIWSDFVSRTAKGQPVRDVVFSFVNAAGEKRFLHSGGIPVFDRDSGKLVAYRGTSRDITDQKSAERELQESEERFSLAMEGAKDGLWDRNLETGEFYYSPRWFEMLGYKIGDLPNTGEAWEALLHPDDGPKAGEFVTNCLEGEGRNYEVEFRMRHKDGHYVDILGRGFAVRDDAGTPIRLVGTNSDVSARKQAESQLVVARTLAESEKRIRSAFENIAIGNLVIDDKGVIEIFNTTASRIFGYTAEEVIGQNVEMLMPTPDRSQHDGYIRNYLENGEAKIIGIGREVTGLRKNGEEFPMHLDVGQMSVGEEVSFIGSITDLTEMKHLEEQVRRSQRLEAVGQLTGGVAHDFNNLLAIMIGNAELLAETVSEDEEVKKRTGAIIGAVERGASLTQRLLAFSRQQTLSPVAKDVAELIDGLEDMLKRALGETVDLRVADMPDLWPATIDPHQFENALVNLAINARDAMPHGGTLTIEAANVTLDQTYVAPLDEVMPGDYVKVAVSDSGTGMPPEVLEKVFEPFFTTKEVGEGSGLGLSMVYGFVRQSGGHVTVYSEVGIGTTINVYLPRSEAVAGHHDMRNDTVELARGSERILIVEDDPDVRIVAVGLLQSQGYEVVEARDGAEAIARLTKGMAFDLLFTDVVLPGGMNGVEIAEQAKRLQPNIKVIYTTGYAENAFVNTGQLDPSITVVNKPYRRAELLEKIRARLDGDEA